jgi:hypothetical protein
MFPSFDISAVNTPLNVFILAVMFGLLGLILLLVYRSRLNVDKKIKSWPSVPGTITSSRVSKKEVSVESHGSTSLQTQYEPHVKYSYTVTGTLYHGERIGNGILVSSLSGPSKRIVKRFTAGATVPVYYDPEDPSQAVLEKTRLSDEIGFLVGVGFCFISVFLVGIWVFDLFRH